MSALIRDERGGALVVALCVILVLATLAVWRVDFGSLVTHAEADFEEGLKRAVKAAAGQVGERSQAEGDPHIVAERAHAAFRKVLADNLALDPATLYPLADSPLAGAPAYSLLIYNGDDEYAAEGCYSAYRYDADGETLSSYPVAGCGRPQSFAVFDLDIAPGSGGVFDVTLDAPGCVAVVKVPLRAQEGDVEVVRWASAKVVRR